MYAIIILDIAHIGWNFCVNGREEVLGNHAEYKVVL